MKYPEEYRQMLKADGWEEWADYGSDQEAGLPRAAAQKPYPEGADLIDLVESDKISVGSAPLREVIARRRSRRSYSEEPLSLEELSFLLWATQGVTERYVRPDDVRTRRTVPSGGSLHSFETYLAVHRVEGLNPGLYRYLPLEDKLLSLRAGPHLREEVIAACRGQEFVGDAAVTFIWTTIPYRMEWRYTIVANKIIAQDSGHLCQNLYLASEAIGAGTCAIGAYDQKKMDSLVDADGEDEFVIYAAPVGKLE